MNNQTMSVEKQLDQYAELLSRIEMLQNQRDEMLEKSLPEELKKLIQEIKDEYDPTIAMLNDALRDIRIAITTNVLTLGSTSKGSNYMAVWNKGRESWDGKKLNGYAMAHPEILQAKTVGEPTVTIRKVK